MRMIQFVASAAPSARRQSAPFEVMFIGVTKPLADKGRAQFVMPDGEHVRVHAVRDSIGDGEIVYARAGLRVF